MVCTADPVVCARSLFELSGFGRGAGDVVRPPNKECQNKTHAMRLHSIPFPRYLTFKLRDPEIDPRENPQKKKHFYSILQPNILENI